MQRREELSLPSSHDLIVTERMTLAIRIHGSQFEFSRQRRKQMREIVILQVSQ